MIFTKINTRQGLLFFMKTIYRCAILYKYAYENEQLLL
jgi:hypothetical protein